MNRPAPLQFGLRSMLVLTGVMGVLFATLNWLDVPPLASSIVLVVLVVSVAAAVGLVAVIAQGEGGRRRGKAEGGRMKDEDGRLRLRNSQLSALNSQLSTLNYQLSTNLGDLVSELELRLVDSISDLRAMTAEWDTLWRCSPVTLPTARAELVALWLEHFAPNARLRVLTVRQAGQLVAALPLVGRKVRAVLPAGDLPMNYWSPNGELLLDPAAADCNAVMDLLAGTMNELPWPLFWLEMVPIEEPRWKALVEALARRGLHVDVHRRYRIGQVEVAGEFDKYEAGLSKNLRRSLRRDARHLEEAGPVRFADYSRFAPQEVDEHLRRAFEIEDRGWKGRAGGSVLGTPGLLEFYRRQCRQLAEWGQLKMAFLLCRGEPIAFELGWTGKGVYHSFKVGYDPAYGQFGPGHLLRKHLIRSLFEQPGNRLVDFQGPLTEALGSWSTQSYPIGRLVVAPHRISSRTLLAAYRTLAPAVRRLRRG